MRAKLTSLEAISDLAKSIGEVMAMIVSVGLMIKIYVVDGLVDAAVWSDEILVMVYVISQKQTGTWYLRISKRLGRLFDSSHWIVLCIDRKCYPWQITPLTRSFTFSESWHLLVAACPLLQEKLFFVTHSWCFPPFLCVIIHIIATHQNNNKRYTKHPKIKGQHQHSS